LELTLGVTLAVLGAALAHATWNALIKSGRNILLDTALVALGLGLIVAFFVAWAVIAGFLTFVKRHSLLVFAYYRIAMGIAVLWIVG